MSVQAALSLIAQGYLNPDKIQNKAGENGMYVDPNGQPTLHQFQTPGFFQRALNDQAWNYIHQNEARDALRPDAELRDNVSYALQLKNATRAFNSMSDVAKQYVGSPERLIGQFGGAAVGSDTGILDTEQKHRASIQEQINAQNKAIADELQGNPITSSQAYAAQLGDTLHAYGLKRSLYGDTDATARNRAATDRYVSETSEPLNANTAAITAGYNNAAAPLLGKYGLNNANFNLQQQPLTLGTEANKNLIGNLLSTFVTPPDPMSMYATQLKGNTLQTGRNPLVNPMFGGNASSPVPGLQAAVMEDNSPKPTIYGTVEGQNFIEGDTSRIPEGMVKVDSEHFVDPNTGHIFFQTADGHANSLPQVSNDLREKAATAVKKATVNNSKKKSLQDEMAKLRGINPTMMSQLPGTLGQEALMLTAPISVPAIAAGHYANEAVKAGYNKILAPMIDYAASGLQ